MRNEGRRFLFNLIYLLLIYSLKRIGADLHGNEMMDNTIWKRMGKRKRR